MYKNLKDVSNAIGFSNFVRIVFVIAAGWKHTCELKANSRQRCEKRSTSSDMAPSTPQPETKLETGYTPGHETKLKH